MIPVSKLPLAVFDGETPQVIYTVVVQQQLLLSSRKSHQPNQTYRYAVTLR